MTTKLLHQIAVQDQAQLAARYNGETKRRRSEWVIDRLREALAPEHVHLANRILDLQATAEGVACAGREHVDGGNGTAISADYRIDAQRALNGYDAAVRKRLGPNGSRCFWAIAWGASVGETQTACRFAQGSHGSAKRLVQLTMMALQDYDDEIRGAKKLGLTP